MHDPFLFSPRVRGMMMYDVMDDEEGWLESGPVPDIGYH